MIIFYIQATGMPTNVMTTYPQSMVDMLQSGEIPLPEGEACIHVHSTESISYDEIEVVDGEFRRRVPMTVEAPSACTVDVECVISGVPDGAAISINGEPAGVMDDSGDLEFTAETAGSYRILIQCSGYIRKEIDIEAHP